MIFLGRLTLETSKKTEKPIERFVTQNDAVHINDDFNKNSLISPTEIIGLDNLTIDNYAQSFEPEEMDLEGGEQMIEVSYRDGGISTTSYEVKLYLDVEEHFIID